MVGLSKYPSVDLPKSIRYFVGIELPEFVRDKLASLQQPLLDGFSWSPPHNFHLTLKFVGQTDASHEEALSQVLERITIQHFLLELSGLGVFPERGDPRVLWVGLHKAPPQLFQLQQKVESELFAMGFDPGNRAFFPHVTLARLGRIHDGQLRKFLREQARFATAPFRVECFTLYSSEKLDAVSRRYTPRARFALRDKNT